MSLLKRVYWKFKWIKAINIFEFLHLNFFCKNIIRESGVYVVPYKGAILELHKTSKLILKGKDLRIGINKIGKSKAETYIKFERGATWNCNNGAALCYGSTIELHDSAQFDSGYFFMNTGSVLITAKHIQLGEDILIGRDNVIYDSDFHPMLNVEGNIKNMPQNVVIGNHVWLTNHVMVQKGVVIHDGAVISPFTVLRKDVPTNSLIANGIRQVCVVDDIRWSSEKL